MSIPRGAQYLIARAQLKININLISTGAEGGFRVRVGTNIGTEVYIDLHNDFDSGFTIYDGNATDNDDVTWWDVTSIVPDPTNGPFDETDWANSAHLLQIQGMLDSNTTDLEIRTIRQWSWLTESYLPSIPPVWSPSEYS
jgi:hypothetical protein